MIKNTFYIETMGCQMNKLDSELMVDLLEREGYAQVDNVDDAGVVIFNTCSVREHAEQKVISKVGQLRRRRLESGDMLLAVVGCMAQRLGQQLADDYKQVDIVCGPGRIHELAEMVKHLREAGAKRGGVVNGGQKGKTGAVGRVVLLNDKREMERLEQLDNSRNFRGSAGRVGHDFQAFVRVMRGCNNYCSYCIVPYVRGTERSRPLRHIVDEARRLADNGVVEVTLLGQTVNHYCYGGNGGDNGSGDDASVVTVSGASGVMKRQVGLADVLAALNDIEGLKRLRFVTNYPRNFDERILEAMAQLDKVCPYLHIPAQSGSDKVLRDMNRKYTAKEYTALIARAREIVPQLAVAGDFIVGFPGENEADFEATMELVRQVHYKNCFVFKYSTRPGTVAARRMTDDVADEIKRRRNTELLALINEIALADNQRFAGQVVEVLVEGPSKKPHLDSKGGQAETVRANTAGMADIAGCGPMGQDGFGYDCQMVGRTPGDYIVVFPGRKQWVGQLKQVRVHKVSALTLFGEVVHTHHN